MVGGGLAGCQNGAVCISIHFIILFLFFNFHSYCTPAAALAAVAVGTAVSCLLPAFRCVNKLFGFFILYCLFSFFILTLIFFLFFQLKFSISIHLEVGE